MASYIIEIAKRATMAVLFILFLFYFGRPLYWKISAAVHEIHQKQSIRGVSQIVMKAQKSVVRAAANRRLLRRQVL